jgi:broad specificity phosphatase PhoE
MSEVILVRHTEVTSRWKSRCYGCSDVGLSWSGRRQARQLAAQLASEPVTSLVCSSLKRARFLADHLSVLTGLEARIDDRWRERDFGTWEGLTWNAIWRDTGNAMDGMLTSPHDFRPGGGETTAELAARALHAFQALPAEGLTVIVTHGGPIAAVRAAWAGAPLMELARFLVPPGSLVRHTTPEPSRPSVSSDQEHVRSIHSHGSSKG